MGLLEWSISARDPFLYLAICLSIPSALLYLAEIGTIVRHKQFHSSFYALFIIRAIPDLLYVLDSYYCFRLTVLLGSFLYPIYSLLPNWMIGLSFFLTGYTFQANNLATAFLLLNRLTAIGVPLKHEKLWKKLLPPVATVVFGLPICTNWEMFKMKGILQVENPENASADVADLSFFLYEDKEAPFVNYLNYIDVIFAVIFMTVCIGINICALFLYKRHLAKQNKGQPPSQTNNYNEADQLERKLFIYALATFGGHALIACLLIGIYIASSAQNIQMVSALYTHYPWVLDTGSVVISSWLLLWAGDSFRQQLLRDYCILPRTGFRFKKRSTTGVVDQQQQQHQLNNGPTNEPPTSSNNNNHHHHHHQQQQQQQLSIPRNWTHQMPSVIM